MIKPLHDGFVPRQRLHKFGRRLRKRPETRSRFSRAKLLLCSVSVYLKASQTVAPFRRTEAGAMPARAGKYCVAVGFRHPVIVLKVELIKSLWNYIQT